MNLSAMVYSAIVVMIAGLGLLAIWITSRFWNASGKS